MTLRKAILMDRLGDTRLEWVQERMGGGKLKKVTSEFCKKREDENGGSWRRKCFILNFDVGEIRTYL